VWETAQWATAPLRGYPGSHVYVTTFAVTAGGGPGKVFVFAPDGRLKRELQVAGSTHLLLGIAFHPQTNPASLAHHGDSIYVTNLSLDLRLFGLPQAVDSQWAGEVTVHTIARLRARIP